MPIIVVTGGSAGIGLAIAERFAASGWDVAILARGASRLAQARAGLEAHGRRVMAVQTDVSDPVSVRAAAQAIVAAWGGVDLWVNNAMSTVVGAAEDITDGEYQRVTATTYLSQVYGTLCALKVMRPVGQGVIVQISSALALRPAPLQAAYCGAKAAIDGFTGSLRAQLRAERSSIAVTTLYLPGVNTPQPKWARNKTKFAQKIPGPLFDPRLCAEAVWRSRVRPPERIWVGRSTWVAAAAQALVPAYAEKTAAGMLDAQLGAPAAPQVGNLETPVDGPAAIDGDSVGRVTHPSIGWIDSRQTGWAKALAVAAIALATVASVYRRGAVRRAST